MVLTNFLFSKGDGDGSLGPQPTQILRGQRRHSQVGAAHGRLSLPCGEEASKGGRR